MVDGHAFPCICRCSMTRSPESAAWIAIAIAGVIAGTLIGMRVLRWIPEAAFRRTVAVLLGLLGAG